MTTKAQPAKSIFVTLPVTDLGAATRFYTAIGCKKNEQFSDHTASTMAWSETITFQLQTREKFATYSSKAVADAHRTCQVLLGVSADSRDHVDAIVKAAAVAGGKADLRAPIDMGWLYNRAFQDPDGHVFEAYWLDPKGLPQGQA